MATEKFFVFNESGTLKRLKGRIVRFLDNEDPDNDDKVNIRASISVPASAEGLTPANNLSDVSSVATSRDNLGVPSDDEVAEATGTKLVGPALYFDGTSSVVEVADDDRFSFTDGVDDLPFSVSAWVKPKFPSAALFATVSKYGTSFGVREWFVDIDSDKKLRLAVVDTSNNSTNIIGDSSLSAYEDEWIHIAATYSGAGPNSDNAFTANMNGAALFVNGNAVAATATNNASYGGMSNTSQAVWLGRLSNSYAKGSIRDVKIFNRELSAAEVAQLHRVGDLGFADEWAGALGGVYSSDFTGDSTNSFTPTRTTLDAASTVDGDTDNLKIVSDATASATHSATRASSSPASGKRANIRGEYYIPSGQTAVDGFEVYIGGGSTKLPVVTGTTDAWTTFEFEVATVRTDTNLYIYLTDGGNPTFSGVAGEYVAFRNIKVTQTGTLADFRAEDYNESASKLLDRSSNNFVGVGTGVTLVGNQRHISADTIDLKNLPTSSAGLSAGEVWSNGGVLTVV